MAEKLKCKRNAIYCTDSGTIECGSAGREYTNKSCPKEINKFLFSKNCLE